MKKNDIYKLMKNHDGGVLKYKDKFRRRTYYFEFDFEDYDKIHRRLFGMGNFYYLLASNGKHMYYQNKSELERFLNQEVQVGQIIDGSIVYGVCDKKELLSLIETVMIPYVSELEEDISVEIEIPVIENRKTTKKKTSFFGSLFKRKSYSKTKSVDFDEVYLEGKRIFEDTDETEEYNEDAESYADDYR